MTGFDGMHWLNPPPRHAISQGVLEIETAAQGDFWQTTYYGFTPDTGHALLAPVSGEVVAELTVAGDYGTLYDQAGLMLRADETHWVKAGVEFADGRPRASVVVTNGVSDWSALELDAPFDPVSLRLTRMGDALFVQLRQGAEDWRMARLAPFPTRFERLEIGPMACSPQRAGFVARLSGFSLGPVTSREIH